MGWDIVAFPFLKWVLRAVSAAWLKRISRRDRGWRTCQLSIAFPIAQI